MFRIQTEELIDHKHWRLKRISYDVGNHKNVWQFWDDDKNVWTSVVFNPELSKENLEVIYQNKPNV